VQEVEQCRLDKLQVSERRLESIKGSKKTKYRQRPERKTGSSFSFLAVPVLVNRSNTLSLGWSEVEYDETKIHGALLLLWSTGLFG
jgi:hypothetical protein